MDDVGIASRDRVIAQQRELLAEQRRLLAVLQQANEALQAQVAVLKQRVRELEGKPRGMPGNKPEPNRPPKPKRVRKRREMNLARRRSEPTVRVEHAVGECPDCGTRLSHGTPWRTREVIEVAVAPVVVTEHVYIERRCPICDRRLRPKPELEGVVVGKQRLGTGLVALIATLRERLRMPIGQIQWYLRALHGLHLSRGAIVYALAVVARAGGGQVQRILEAVRASPVANADETGWREDGANGYVWVYSTPTEKYFVRGGRGGEMVKVLLGDSFGGVLISDFYAAYDTYPGYHQRCWAHLLRDLAELVSAHPQDEGVGRWAEGVRRLYRKARLYARLGKPEHKHEVRRHLERQLLALAEPYLADKGAPQHKLAKRIDRYEGELFVFVGREGVPSDNNGAERDLRHLVTSRKISGGTRSQAGTQVKMALSTLFGTWAARDLNPHDECRRLLTSPQF